MLPSINELLYRSLSSDVAQMRNDIQALLTRAERSEVTGGVAGLTLAQLPLTHNTGGDLYFATDGCKPGEATGHGTGVEVFWDTATTQWLRVGDYQPPSGGTPLPVASGGTGESSLTAHSMLIGNGASPILFLAPGASTQVAISNGTDWTSRTLVSTDLPVGVGSPLTTKGDLYGFDTVNNRVPAGVNGAMLIANSAAALGLNWANNPTIIGGTIDSAPIGGTFPAAITGTTITANTSLTVTGLTALTATHQVLTALPTLNTAYVYGDFVSAGGSLLIGLEASTNQLITGGHAYAGLLYTSNATDLQLGSNNTVRLTINSSGDFAFGSGKHGFFAAMPVVQPSATGTATGYAAGTTAATFHEDDTYTGNSGTTKYTVNGIVAALKSLGLLAA